ncbi:MAG: energy-coupling factor ABC transporter ATP-binding protein [Candidatus Heimdallarchaeum endolithica]|uniref:Energy-coupling factor ABC transporter ATP-binding protein n=1 Tax=Candidatus Heimdallarchaeum endolithica TaxID=2876572 RepID=A0A9Y1BP17_9ARCH|nr:MAG: energy-coupling factor ABC transporter ATP-binding protein [Candidatus Heimdallarchaeum endolithica]
MQGLDSVLNIPIVEFKNFSFKYHFREKYVIENLSFKINQGETILLTGFSGSGKSTILYSILGLIPHLYKGDTKGEVYVNGKNVLFSKISRITEQVGYIPQRVNNFITEPTVYEELSFGLEYKQTPSSETRVRVLSIAEDLSLKELLPRNPRNISEGEKQKTCLGSTLISYPELIIADEPLANLDEINQKKTTNLLLKLKEQKYTIIIASHDISKYSFLSPKIFQIQNKKITEIRFNEIENRDSFLLKIKRIYPQNNSLTKNENTPFSLVLDKVHFKYKEREESVFENLSLSINNGKIVGIIGNNGTGKTTLLSLITGLLKPIKGQIAINNRYIHKFKWLEKASLFGFVSQNPELQFFEETVENEVTLILRNLKRKVPAKERIIEVLKEAGLGNYSLYSPFSLSEGEKGRLAFIASTFHNPKVILLDEITNGMDFENKRWLQKQLIKEKEKGKIILFASHDLMFLNSVADEIFVLKNKQLNKVKRKTKDQE